MIFTNYETIIVTNPHKKIFILTLNRPKFSNAFNTKMATEIVDFFERIPSALKEIYAIIVTGQGQKSFCAGGDLKERDGMTDEAWFQQHIIFEKMIRSILDCPVPTIGAVNGAAYGGGCELVAGLDFAYCSTTAKFAQTETKLGIIPGAGGTQTLSRAVGERRAKEIILSGSAFSAKQAFEWGLVNRLCDPGELMKSVLDVAKTIASNAPVAVRQAKHSIHRGMQLSIRDGLAFEVEAYNRTVVTFDRLEGVRAFNEGRKPKFKGN